jgi:hypothetical protein
MSNNVSSALVLSTPVDTLTLLATGNTITGCNDTGIAVIASTASLNENITINNNTITNIGNTQSAIDIAQGSSILNFTAENNTIDNCEGSGIVFYSNYSEFTNMTASIAGNTISNCQNLGGNAASGISLDTYLDLTSTATNNTLLNNDPGTPGVAVGYYTGGNPNVCLTLTSNNSSTVYSFTNPGSGAFNLAPLNVDLVNTGIINTSGTITPVTSCP